MQRVESWDKLTLTEMFESCDLKEYKHSFHTQQQLVQGNVDIKQTDWMTSSHLAELTELLIY